MMAGVTVATRALGGLWRILKGEGYNGRRVTDRAFLIDTIEESVEYGSGSIHVSERAGRRLVGRIKDIIGNRHQK
ncbi:hypothetical protein [Megasphaera massiliensis]|uniref:hypothetical protein n=1 Tax=Megasphaera massiliensis TaxID=1232428 RepID=UPI00040ED205|nr:hypothetical protein [uncultured Megasphaera sp.]